MPRGALAWRRAQRDTRRVSAADSRPAPSVDRGPEAEMDPNLPAQSPGQPPRAAPARQRRATRESTLVDDDLVSCFMWASGEPGKEANRQASDGGERSLGAPADEYEGGHAAAGTSLQPPDAGSCGGGGGGSGCDASDPEYVKQLEAKVGTSSRDGITSRHHLHRHRHRHHAPPPPSTTLTLHHPPPPPPPSTSLHRTPPPPPPPRRCTC